MENRVGKIGLVGWLIIGLTGVVVFSSDYSVNAVASGDDRFGIGGDCKIAKDLSIPWGYNWGHGWPYANRTELETCMKDNGVNSFLMLGKLDNNNNYRGGTLDGVDYSIPSLETRFLNDPTTTQEEKDWYQTIRTILHNQKKYYVDHYNGTITSTSPNYNSDVKNYGYMGQCPNTDGANTSIQVDPATLGINNCFDNAKSSFLLIKYKYTKPENGGKLGLVYSITNEPDMLPEFLPSEYAQYYNAFYRMVKKYDLTAKVMVGGVTAGNGWSARDSSTGVHQWVSDFINSYRSQFGSIPPVDIWGVHIYAFDKYWTNIADRALNFRSFLTDKGYLDKPMWLTEFGTIKNKADIAGVSVSYGPHYVPVGVTSFDELSEKLLSSENQQKVYRYAAGEFVSPLIKWFKGDTSYNLQASPFQKWFLYYGGHLYNSRVSGVANGQQEVWFSKLEDTLNIYKLPNTLVYNDVGVSYALLSNPGFLGPTPVSTSTPVPTQSLVPAVVPACGVGMPIRGVGNANCDAVVDVNDYAIWYTEYQKYKSGGTQTGGWKADFNSDGRPDLADLLIWKTEWGK